MNVDEQVWQVRRKALQVLDECGKYALPEHLLIDSMQVSLASRPTRSECERTILWLEGQGFVKGTTSRLGEPRKWALTDEGRLQL